LDNWRAVTSGLFRASDRQRLAAGQIPGLRRSLRQIPARLRARGDRLRSTAPPWSAGSAGSFKSPMLKAKAGGFAHRGRLGMEDRPYYRRRSQAS
jgi:hypothetical protein